MEGTLIHLILGFHQFTNNNRKDPHQYLEKGFQLFIQQCNANDLIPPKNYQELISILRKPAGEWGIQSVKTYYPEDLALLDRFLRPVPETDEMTYSIDERIDQFSMEQIDNHFHQVSMRKFFNYCRKHHLKDVYQKVREMIGNPSFAVVSSPQLFSVLNEFDEEIEKYIKAFYEPIQNIEHYRRCPYCHWTLTFDEVKQKYVCNNGSPCHKRANLQHGQAFTTDNSSYDYLRLKPGIQRFTLIPSISERRMKRKLEKKGFVVEMYPEIDTFDLYATRGSLTLKLDAKDYASPFFLAKRLVEEMTREQWDEDVIYVIPYEIYERDRHYIHDVSRILEQLIQQEDCFELEAKFFSLKIADERTLLREVGETFNAKVFAAINKLHTPSI